MSAKLLFMFVLAAALMQLFAGTDRARTQIIETTLAVHTVSVIGGSARAGNQFVVGIELESGGDELGGSFTLNFDPTKLSISNLSHPNQNPDVSLGPGIPSTGATLFVNANQASSGRIGISTGSGSTYLASPPNRLFVLFRFTVATNAPVGPTGLAFGDSPVPRGFSNGLGDPIAMTWVPGMINIEPPTTTSYEGDIAPRTTGDEAVLAIDVILARRFSTGLDVPATSSEFQRADSSPRSTLGDGFINASDVIQARRYSIGLDPLTIAGGPSGPPPGLLSVP